MTGVLDERRSQEIARYQVIGRSPREELVALAQIAAELAGVPMAAISLVDESCQHQIATVGFTGTMCAREDALCNVALAQEEPIVVEDARTDARFSENPFVTGVLGSVRFYGGYQLRTTAGVVIGMLCLLDTEPRTLPDSKRTALARLADRVVDLLELEVRSRELEERSSELGAVVQRLRGIQEELQRSNDQLAAFAGQISHDLHNPLSAVSMSLSMITEHVEDPDADPDALRFVVERASRATRRMQSLIDGLLAFARLDGQLAMTEVDLERLVAEAAEDIDGQLGDLALEIGPLPVVSGDVTQLRAVFQNLLTNSSKFRSPDRPLAVSISARRTEGWWRIEVTDTGVGIPADKQSQVFEPFVRSHASVPGSGIGLATVKGVVQAHGGRVGALDAPGGGTTIWLELPARRAG